MTVTCCFSDPSWDPFPGEYSPWRRGGVAGANMGRGGVHQGCRDTDQTGQTGSQHCSSLVAKLELEVSDGSPASLECSGRAWMGWEGSKSQGRKQTLSKMKDVEETWTKLPEFYRGGVRVLPAELFFPQDIQILTGASDPSRRCCRRLNQHQHMEGS